MKPVDFGKTASDYRTHRAGFPEAFFVRAAGLGVGVPGQAIVDVGTGTGTLARGFALRGARVAGIDPAETMLAQARQLDGEAGVRVDYRVAKAEGTGLPDGEFDVVTAGQCWHWFDRDKAAREAWRLLRRGGMLAIAHFDWLPLAGNVVAATEALILKHNPDWRGAGGNGIHPQAFTDLATAGFVGIESFAFDHPVVYSHNAWRGRIRASAGIAASLPPEAVAAFDAEHAALLAGHFPANPLIVPHRVFMVLGRKYP
ncbi:class I SAM-dependent methyltransferase [Jeongeupia naejangsanensis]|uniref:Methyltransferase domain-containing protein n=1 Tax=Jeongeupia naejangsanensis TaxID=613195 RepID=A0ABS2BLB3_9NEIS|nr:class I SAM-dependent methyltransferase [Jeongeupia naejangsanensis]MBM3115776.1 methyltransferase domain-containing protein [Jeongeupia naejangsanensis]